MRLSEGELAELWEDWAALDLADAHLLTHMGQLGKAQRHLTQLRRSWPAVSPPVGSSADRLPSPPVAAAQGLAGADAPRVP